MRRAIAALVAIIVCALIYAGLGYVTNASAATITLGASVQLSGPLANVGRYYRDGYQFAVDQINEGRRSQNRKASVSS